MNKTIQPAAYWRRSQELKHWLGQVGEVVAVTRIHTSSPDMSVFTPYSYAIVDFKGEKKELMVSGNEEVAVGDKVVCVLRKLGQVSAESLIEYGLKVVKIATKNKEVR